MRSFTRKFFLIFIVSISTLNAQPFFDVLSYAHQKSFPVLSHTAKKKDVSYSYNSIDLSLPIKFSEDFLIIAPSYENDFISFDDSTRSMSVQCFKLPLAFAHKWKSSSWKTTLLIVGRSCSSTKNNWNENSLQYGGAVVMAYEKNKNLVYKFGVYYNSEFFGPFIIPLLGIDYRPNDRMKIFGILPGSMNLEYKFSNLIRGGFMFRSLTSSYRTLEHQFLRINDNQLKAFVDFYLAKKHVITLEAGHSILREFKSGIRISGDSDYSEFKTADGLILKIGYAFRIRLDENDSTKK